MYSLHQVPRRFQTVRQKDIYMCAYVKVFFLDVVQRPDIR